MKRRTFLQSGLTAMIGAPLLAALKQDRLDDAAEVLAAAVAKQQVAAAVLHVEQGEFTWTRHFGSAKSNDAMFLLGSISKPICITSLMALFDAGKFQLDDPLKKYLPKFNGDGRDKVTLRHLMSHVSGLPDQLPENNELRKQHASLDDFVTHAVRTALKFAPGTDYEYSSMAILLACHVAEIIGGDSILKLVDEKVFRPLKMMRSAQGIGRFVLQDFLPVQTEFAAPEAGAGDPSAKDWDWNSPYWRKLGAPWGGTHASAPDIGKFLAEFLFARGAAIKPETAKLMLTNQNREGLTPRGLGFNIGKSAGKVGCSEHTFGHTGSTGTICWADPASQTICVVLTSLPGRAVQLHPRDFAAAEIAAAAG